MKKIVLFTILVAACLTLVACGGKEDDEEEIVGGWETVFADKEMYMSAETLKIFEDAKKDYTDLELKPVALLGTQVVAGTNYMYLAKGYVEGKEDIVYKDLSGKPAITKVTDFDYTKYVNENVESDSDVLAGGWYVDFPKETELLDKETQEVFDNATSTLTGMVYYPIAVLGSQVVAGTNYAILCYGSASYEDMPGAIYLITIYSDLNNKQEITSHAYVDLANYNK